jgi:hypothetical protein
MTAEPKYDMTVHPTHALVRSQSNGAAAHQVTFPSCDCADFINRRGKLIEVDGGLAVTLCKHVAEGLRRIGGWHRDETAAPQQAAVYYNLMHGDVKELLRGPVVGFSPREANQVISKATHDGEAVFKGFLTDLPADGILTYDQTTSRYTLTVTGRVQAAGMNRATAYDKLLEASVSRSEANRVLREAAFNGSSWARPPGTGALLVRHEGGIDDGLFFIPGTPA